MSAPISRSWLRRFGYRGLQMLCQLAPVVGGYRCVGRAHLPASGGALLCANHQSVLDPVLVGLAVPRRMNYLARRTLFDHPLLARVIRFLDAIPIEREGLGLAGLKETIRRLRREELVLMFPEGTRTRDGRLGPLRPGLLAIARRCQVPLVPVGLAGAFEIWPRGARLPRLGPVVVAFGPPLLPRALGAFDDRAALAELQRRMTVCWRSAYAARYRWWRTLPRPPVA